MCAIVTLFFLSFFFFCLDAAHFFVVGWCVCLVFEGTDASPSGSGLDFSQKMAAAFDAAGVRVNEDQAASTATPIDVKKPGVCVFVW